MNSKADINDANDAAGPVDGALYTDPLPIRYQDADMVVVAKPAGMLIHRDIHSRTRECYVVQTVSRQIGQYVYPVHRLDRNTSGLVALALKKEMAAALHLNLADPTAYKTYLTLVRQETEPHFVSDRPLSNHNGEPQPAHSEFTRLATFSRCSILEVRITTGRHHQIRRHLAHLAHQVIGDSSHGKGRINEFFRSTYGLPRMFLHASRLAVRHPRTDEMLDLREPLADDLRAFLSRLPDVDPDFLASI